jgi:hypothetical protein
MDYHKLADGRCYVDYGFHLIISDPTQLAYGAQMADDFESGSRSAVAGGNTTILPFSLQPRGKSLRQSAPYSQIELRHISPHSNLRPGLSRHEAAPRIGLCGLAGRCIV